MFKLAPVGRRRSHATAPGGQEGVEDHARANEDAPSADGLSRNHPRPPSWLQCLNEGHCGRPVLNDTTCARHKMDRHIHCGCTNCTCCPAFHGVPEPASLPRSRGWPRQWRWTERPQARRFMSEGEKEDHRQAWSSRPRKTLIVHIHRLRNRSTCRERREVVRTRRRRELR
jgi:hypothetical protein